MKNITENQTFYLEDFTRKRQIFLTYIGGEWYLNSLSNPKPPTVGNLKSDFHLGS